VRSISTVVVSWNSGESLSTCVESLARSREELGEDFGRLELVVVDNASEDFPEALLLSRWPDARLLRLPGNSGFGPAANRGAAVATGEVVFFLNPDTRAHGCPWRPLAAAFENPEVVAAAPRLVDVEDPIASEPQQEFQLRRLPNLSSTARELFLLDRAMPGLLARRKERYLDRSREEPFDVEQPAGAALAVRRDVFNELGGFDPRFVPAWWEDVDLCRRLGRRGRIVYVPESVFAHRGGESARALGYSRFVPIYWRNALRYWRKHHGRAAALAVRGMIVAGMGMRLAALPFRRRDPRPKAASAAAYLRTLRMAVLGR
jgi:N-acetylglucosaminyl-diphospho-decaprenol L-rhamnosyltransferase